MARTHRVHDRLVVAGALFAAAVVLHNGDHVRRGADAVDADVFWLGTGAIAVEVALVVLICQRHRLAPLAAAVTGASLAAGYVFVHFLPERQWLSDPLVGREAVDSWSVFAASFETAAAVALAVAGVAAVARLGGLDAAGRSRSQQRGLREGVLHPVALAFAITQAVTVALSFSQL